MDIAQTCTIKINMYWLYVTTIPDTSGWQKQEYKNLNIFPLSTEQRRSKLEYLKDISLICGGYIGSVQ